MSAIRSDTVFKLAFNRTLEHLSSGDDLGLNESTLARQLGISRTTSRKVLGQLENAGITGTKDRRIALRRLPEPSDRFPQVETLTGCQNVERRFMEWIFNAETRPGSLIDERDLARQFGVAPGPLREYLIGFSRYGLIEKKPNATWLFRGFTKDFALDLFEVRTLFELRLIRLFTELPPTSPLWTDLQTIRTDHLAVLAEPEAPFQGFCALDDRLHTPDRGLCAQPFHHRFSRDHRPDLPLPLPMEPPH